MLETRQPVGQGPDLSNALFDISRKIDALDPDSDAAKFLHVGMMRTHNRTATALAEAIRALEACLHTLGATPR